MSAEIGKIKKVHPRVLWEREDRTGGFTPWLEENIDYLNDALDLRITIEASEKRVGTFRVDLYGEDARGNKVIIENQLETTDHDHLGKVITYLVNLEAKTAIWITTDHTYEHEMAIDWLNSNSQDDIAFYLVKLEAIQIGGSSPYGPQFTVVRKPTTVQKQLGAEHKEYAQRQLTLNKYWTQFTEEFKGIDSLFSALEPNFSNWIKMPPLGHKNITMYLGATSKYAKSEVYMETGNKIENKKVFDYLSERKGEIENMFGNSLKWERMDKNISSRVKYELDGVNVNNEDDWDKMNEFIFDGAKRMHKVFQKFVSEYNKTHGESG